jgi:chromate reductase, NAD(P)H dehydrogenase (quinone)
MKILCISGSLRANSISTSPHAHLADAALREVLITMSARLVGPASTRIALLGAAMTEDEMVNPPLRAAAIADVFEALYDLPVSRQL